MPISGSWGFKRSDTDFKSTTTLIRNLVDIASKGGNYLLNVSPTGEGTLLPQSVERLQAIQHPKLIMMFDAILVMGPEHGRVYAQAGWGRDHVPAGSSLAQDRYLPSRRGPHGALPQIRRGVWVSHGRLPRPLHPKARRLGRDQLHRSLHGGQASVAEPP